MPKKPENLVGEEGQGWTIAKFLLENERGGGVYAPKLLRDLEDIFERSKITKNGPKGMMNEDHNFLNRYKEIKLEAQALETTELRILADRAKGRPLGSNSSIVKLVGSILRQKIDSLALSLAGFAGLNLETSRPLYGNEKPRLVDDNFAQLAAPTYLNGRAWTIFGGTNEVQRTIIAKTVLGL